jgi:hypothetical protein
MYTAFFTNRLGNKKACAGVMAQANPEDGMVELDNG